MKNRLMLPVGIEDFKEIRNGKFYYVDKTKLIEQLLLQRGKVNLFLRPRRFGKTLNMSMLRRFFEIGADKSLFDSLYIAENKELCAEHTGKYPVVFVSFKDASGLTFEEAVLSLIELIKEEVRRCGFLIEGDKLNTDEKTFTKICFPWMK